MDRKSVLNLLLSKVDPEKKESFKEELKACSSKEDRAKVMQKFGIEFTEDEKKYLDALKNSSMSMEELDRVAGGCFTLSCSCWTCSHY